MREKTLEQKFHKGSSFFILANLNVQNYANPEKAAIELSKDDRIESVDIITGEYELLIKYRANDNEDYYQFIREKISKYGFASAISFLSLKQIKP